MANITDTTGLPYNWDTEGVYQLETSDPVEGGAEGIANRQAIQLARRSRDLHGRLSTAETKLSGIAEGANNYQHPASHPASMITDTAEKVVMTATERSKLSGIEAGATGDQTATEVRNLLASLVNDNRLDASAIKGLAQAGALSGEVVRDLLAALTGDSRLDASAIKNLATTMTAAQIRDALATLAGTDRLDASAVKNLPDFSGLYTYDGDYDHSSSNQGWISFSKTPLTGGNPHEYLEIHVVSGPVWSGDAYYYSLAAKSYVDQKCAALEARIAALENA